MSNCIRIENDIIIPLKYINTINLFHDMDEINGLDSVSGADVPLKEYIIWWFLSKHNVWKEKDDLVIRLGGHRSMHTERDLRQVGYVLYEYIVPMPDGDHIHCPIDVQNECDGFEETYRDELIIAPYKDQ